MKHFNIIGVIMMALVIASCGGNKSGKTFAPEERQSSMTDSERKAAVAQKIAELDGLNMDTLLFGHNVKIGIVQPKVQGEDITQDIADRISMKMMQMASQNGISGIGAASGFVLGTEIAQTGRAATGTAPQKMTVKYDLTFKVVNVVTGDVYASATQEVTGVGNSFVEANQNFVKEIKNTPAIQKMLQTASERIVKWYDENLETVKNQVAQAEADGDFALAMGILSSVPEQAKEAFEWSSNKQPATQKAMLHKQAADMLGEMESVIASAGDEFTPAAGAYFQLIPTDAPEYAKAQGLYAEYQKKCNARRADLEAKAERDEQAARELDKVKMLYDHEEELANIEARKVKAKYQAMAAAKANKSRSIFGALGDAISGVSERVFSVADVAGAALTDKLGLGDYVNR